MESLKAIQLNKDFIPTATININNCGGGVLLQQNEDKSKVLLFNKNNLGDYAIIEIANNQYDIIDDFSASNQLEIKKLEQMIINSNKTEFKLSTFKEYDEVELIEDKPQYAKMGVTKGMHGVIMQPYAVKGYWFVIFSEDGTGRDIASIAVNEKDIKLCK